MEKNIPILAKNNNISLNLITPVKKDTRNVIPIPMSIKKFKSDLFICPLEI